MPPEPPFAQPQAYAQQAYSPAPWQPVYGPAVVIAKNNGLAIASMILGILWLYWLGSVLAVIFGHVALSQISKSGGTQQGRGMAIAGLVLGYIGVGVFLLIVLASAAAA